MHDLLNIADETLATYISQSDFDASLVHHFLFQESTLIPEGYIGDSRLMFSHIMRARERGEKSLLLCAAEAGILRMAMAVAEPSDPVKGSLSRMNADYGNAWPIFLRDNRVVRHLIESSFSDGIQNGATPFQWPSDHQGSRRSWYLKTLRRMLQSERLPVEARWDASPNIYVQGVAAGFESARRTRLHRLWKETADWRLSCIDRAVELMGTEQDGVSRTAVVNAFGEHLGIPKTKDGSQIPLMMLYAKDREAIGVFLKWITQCYHLTDANLLRAAVHFPVYQLNKDFIAESLLPSDDDPASLEPSSLRLRVPLPPPEKLSLVPPQYLLDIRNTFGGAYFESIRDWANTPNDFTKDCVKVALTEYSEQLNRLIAPETLYDISLRSRGTRTRTDHLSGLSEPIGNIVDEQLGIPFAAYVKLFQKAVQRVTWHFKRGSFDPIRQSIDMTLPGRVSLDGELDQDLC